MGAITSLPAQVLFHICIYHVSYICKVTYAGNDIYNGTYALVSISTNIYMKSYVWFRPSVSGTYAYIYKMHISTAPKKKTSTHAASEKDTQFIFTFHNATTQKARE